MSRRAVMPLAIAAIGLLPFVAALGSGEIFTFRDHADYFGPLRHFTAERLAAGDLPLWNPYNASGERWLANPQTAVFYPPAWLMLLLPFATGYVAFLAFHVILAGLGSWLFFSRWFGAGPSLLGAVAVMLQGPVLSLLDIGNNLATLAWLPLLLAIALARTDSPPRVPLPVASIVLALMFLGGEPFLAAIGWLLYFLIALARSSRRLIEPGATVLLALALVSVQLVPFLEMLWGSERAAGLARAESLAESLAPADWLSAPLALAGSGGASERLILSQEFIPTLYLGALVVLGALLGLIVFPRDPSVAVRRLALASLALFAISVIVSAGARGATEELWLLLRLDLTRYPARLAPLGGMAVAALAVIGFDRAGRASRLARLLATAVVVLVILLAAFVFHPPGRLLAVPLAVSLASALLFGAVALFRPDAFSNRRLALVLALALAVDLVASNRFLLGSAPFNPQLPLFGEVIDSPAKIVRLPDRGSESDRWSPGDRRAWLSGYLNLFGRFFDASTPAPVISVDYARLHDLAVWGPRFDILDFLAVGYLLTDREIAMERFEPVARVGAVSVLANRRALPVVQTWSGWATASSDEEAARLALAHGMRRNVFVAGVPARHPPSAPLPARAVVRSLEGDSAVIEVEAAASVLVTLSQLSAPGWEVTIDGSRAETLRANGMFLAAIVPAGSHQVEWKYNPPFLTPAVIVSSLGLLICAVAILQLGFPRKRGKREARALGSQERRQPGETDDK